MDHGHKDLEVGAWLKCADLDFIASFILVAPVFIHARMTLASEAPRTSTNGSMSRTWSYDPASTASDDSLGFVGSSGLDWSRNAPACETLPCFPPAASWRRMKKRLSAHWYV